MEHSLRKDVLNTLLLHQCSLRDKRLTECVKCSQRSNPVAADGQGNILAVGSGQGSPQKRVNPHKDINCIKSTHLLQSILHEPLNNDLQFKNAMEPLFLKWFCGFRKKPDRWLQIVRPVHWFCSLFGPFSFGPAKRQNISEH